MRNVKFMRLRSVAIFFMIYFYRAGGHGPLGLPRPLVSATDWKQSQKVFALNEPVKSWFGFSDSNCIRSNTFNTSDGCWWLSGIDNRSQQLHASCDKNVHIWINSHSHALEFSMFVLIFRCVSGSTSHLCTFL